MSIRERMGQSLVWSKKKWLLIISIQQICTVNIYDSKSQVSGLICWNAELDVQSLSLGLPRFGNAWYICKKLINSSLDDQKMKIYNTLYAFSLVQRLCWFWIRFKYEKWESTFSSRFKHWNIYYILSGIFKKRCNDYGKRQFPFLTNNSLFWINWKLILENIRILLNFFNS